MDPIRLTTEPLARETIPVEINGEVFHAATDLTGIMIFEYEAAMLRGDSAQAKATLDFLRVAFSKVCPSCDGEGKDEDGACATCLGVGRDGSEFQRFAGFIRDPANGMGAEQLVELVRKLEVAIATFPTNRSGGSTSGPSPTGHGSEDDRS